MRHGQAVPHASCDEERTLTSVGEAQALKVGSLLKNVRIARVVMSPYLRAVQTTLLVTRAAGIQAQTFRSEALVPEAPVNVAVDFILSHATDSILVVTHLPLIASVASFFLDEHEEDHRFGTGELYVLSGMDPPYILEAKISPEYGETRLS